MLEEVAESGLRGGISHPEKQLSKAEKQIGG